jgi:hypothetical protein
MDLKQVQILAIELMDKYGLLDLHWHFKFDNSHMRFGVCKYSHKIIGLSKPLVLINDEAKVKDTILHEIAHALTPGHGHDSVWRRKAIELGCNGERCYTELDTNIPEYRYIGLCKNGHIYKRHKATSKTLSCGKCYPRFNDEYIIKWELNPNYN